MSYLFVACIAALLGFLFRDALPRIAKSHIFYSDPRTEEEKLMFEAAVLRAIYHHGGYPYAEYYVMRYRDGESRTARVAWSMKSLKRLMKKGHLQFVRDPYQPLMVRLTTAGKDIAERLGQESNALQIMAS